MHFFCAKMMSGLGFRNGPQAGRTTATPRIVGSLQKGGKVHNVHTVYTVHNVHMVHMVHNVHTVNSEQFTKKTKKCTIQKNLAKGAAAQKIWSPNFL